MVNKSSLSDYYFIFLEQKAVGSLGDLFLPGTHPLQYTRALTAQSTHTHTRTHTPILLTPFITKCTRASNLNKLIQASPTRQSSMI